MKSLHYVTHILITFTGVCELKVRQIDHHVIFGWRCVAIVAITSVTIYFWGQYSLRNI